MLFPPFDRYNRGVIAARALNPAHGYVDHAGRLHFEPWDMSQRNDRTQNGMIEAGPVCCRLDRPISMKMPALACA
jgi:hypothetical protein